MTKEELTYLSFIHCLLRTVPGNGQFLHATGTDNETALRNAVSAGFYRSHPLLSYLHSKKNVKEKARQLGLSQSLTARILEDLYAKKSGLVWSSSKEEFDTRVQGLLQEWETLESSERKGPAKFGDYFCQFKLEDMQERMSKYVMEGLGLGEEPYIQNIPESVNSMIKLRNAITLYLRTWINLFSPCMTLLNHSKWKLNWPGLASQGSGKFMRCSSDICPSKHMDRCLLRRERQQSNKLTK